MEEEKDGLSMCEMHSWFEWKGIKLNTEWLSAALSHLGRKATIKSIFEQFVFSRLEDSYVRPMKIPHKAAKIVLTKKIVFQVISVINVARPIFEQLKDELRTENNLTWFYGGDAEESIMEDTNEDQNEWKGRQCLMITVTDGVTTLKGIDCGGVEGFTDELPIGSKIMIVDRVMCRRGVMVLKRTNCTILGGAFDSDEDEMTKVERLSSLLPTGKPSKIKPYLSRVKKEFDLNQRTISPFLRRLPAKSDPPPLSSPLIPHDALPNASAVVLPCIPSSSGSPILSTESTNIIMPPSSIASTRRSSPPRQMHSSLPASAVVAPSVKMEEIDPKEKGHAEEKGKGPPLENNNNRLDDSFNTTVISKSKRIMPIIPSMAHFEMQSSEVDPLNHTRVDVPQRPCVKLTPQTLAERIEARHASGRDTDVRGKSIASTDANRSIASYFQAKKTNGASWNKKTQKVEPSNRKELEERKGNEECKRIRDERKMTESYERMRNEEINVRDEEERVIEYYDQMRRRNNEEIKMREQEEQKRRSYNFSNPQVSVVVSTPAPCSYATPPAGFVNQVSLPQLNQMHSMIPPSIAQPSHIHPMERIPSNGYTTSSNQFFLFGADSRPSVPMHLFGSPARLHSSEKQSIVPFKKTKTQDQMTGEMAEEYGFHNFKMNYESDKDRSYQFNHQSSHMPFHELQGGMRTLYSSELQFPPPDTLQMQRSVVGLPLMEMKREAIEGGRLSLHNEDIHSRYLALNAVSLKDVLSKRKFWMMPKIFHVVPLYAMIDRNLNIEQGLWDMKMKVVDESGEIIMCQLDHKLIEDLLGMSVEAARHVRESDLTQFHKFKDRGCKMFKSMERMDLVLNVEVTPIPTEIPTITKIRTLPEMMSML